MPRRASSDNVVRLTKPLIPTLAVGEGHTERVVWDTEAHGLGLRLRRSGSAAWVIRPPRKGGASRVFTLGPLTALSLADAREAAKKRIASATLGTDPHAEREAARARAAVTFGSLLPRYLARAEARLRASSYKDVRHYLDAQFRPLHDLPISDVRRAQVAARLGEIASQSGPYAADRARAALSAFFAWLVGEGLAEQNVVIGTNKAATESARERVLTDAELKAVWLASGEEQFGRIVRLLILTGQRREEVAAMRWSELDLQVAVWRLPPERTKNGRPHDVPLAAGVLAILGTVLVREERDLLFGERTGGFSGFSKAKVELDKRAGLTVPWRLHDLRRTAATGMAGIGVLPHVVEAVLNHVSGSRAGVAGIYNHAKYNREKREALELWAGHVLALGQPRLEVVPADANTAG